MIGLMKVREALLDEAEIISEIAILSKAYWNYSSEFIQACKEDLTIDQSYIQENHVYVLESEEGVVGFFAFQLKEQNSLDFFYVHPSYIGMSYGKVMWNSIIKTAKQLGVKTFTIDSDPNAKGFYEKMGAKQIGETPSTVFEGRTLPLMKYDLIGG